MDINVKRESDSIFNVRNNLNTTQSPSLEMFCGDPFGQRAPSGAVENVV